MARADEPPTCSIEMPLYHEEGSEQKYSKLDSKEMIEDDEGIENMKGVWHQLSRDHMVKDQNIHQERVKREPKISIEKLLVHSHGWMD